MTKQELREKIINTIKENGVYNGKSMHRDYYVINDEDLADALIAAEIGDVSEYKHRAERAERALQKFAENITCEDCPFFSDCDSSEKMEDLIHANYCFAEYLKQAEKELQEERKNEQ